MFQSERRSLEIARTLLALVVVLMAIPFPVSAQSLVGLAMEDVAHLPGVTEIFSRDTSRPPEILHENFVPGEVLVRFYLDLSDEAVEIVARDAGAVGGVRRLSPLGLFLVSGPPSVPATENLMMKLWESQTAVTIEPNYLGGELAFVPNDPHHVNGNQWHHESPSDIDLDMEAAWDITRGSEDVVVAVIDSGVPLNSPEYAGRLYVNPGEIPDNGLDDDGNGFPDDVSGWNILARTGDISEQSDGNAHGTWVSSIIMANVDNDHQVAGVDHFVKLLHIKVTDDIVVRSGDLVAALDYLILNPGVADVVNMSLADLTAISSLGSALSAVAQSSILIGGSGNNGQNGDADFEFPESHPDVITVSGTDQFDLRASFSTSGDSVDFSAPAVDIVTASLEFYNDPFAFHSGLGTSMATPIVSGVATLCLAMRPNMTKLELIWALKQSVVDLGSPTAWSASSP